MKQLPCCARLTGRVTHHKNNLRTLAKRAAYADQKGRDITKFKASMEETKVAIEQAERAVLDHEADHADGRLPKLDVA